MTDPKRMVTPSLNFRHFTLRYLSFQIFLGSLPIGSHALHPKGPSRPRAGPVGGSLRVAIRVDQPLSASAQQGLSKRVLPDCPVRGLTSSPLDLDGEKATTANMTMAIRREQIKTTPIFFLSDRQKVHCCRILVAGLRVPREEGGWKCRCRPVLVGSMQLSSSQSSNRPERAGVPPPGIGTPVQCDPACPPRWRLAVMERCFAFDCAHSWFTFFSHFLIQRN